MTITLVQYIEIQTIKSIETCMNQNLIRIRSKFGCKQDISEAAITVQLMLHFKLDDLELFTYFIRLGSDLVLTRK